MGEHEVRPYNRKRRHYKNEPFVYPPEMWLILEPDPKKCSADGRSVYSKMDFIFACQWATSSAVNTSTAPP